MSVGVVAVDELAQAYRAAISGEFRSGSRASLAPTTARRSTSWAPSPGERIVLVLGCGGGSGTSTVALAMAESADEARVVECCSAGASGLSAASTAELGRAGDGWVRGSREPGSVTIEHRSDMVADLADLPVPTAFDGTVTVLDSSCDVSALLASRGWLGEVARTAPEVIAVARPTVPGLRRLEATLGLLGEARTRPVLVGVGRRWSRQVEQAFGPACRRLHAAGRIHSLPHDPGLAFAGLGPAPLPAAVVAAVADVIAHLERTPA